MKTKHAQHVQLPPETLMLMGALVTALLDGWDRGALRSAFPMLDSMKPTLRATAEAGDPAAVVREIVRLMDIGMVVATDEAGPEFRAGIAHARRALELLAAGAPWN